MSSNKAKEGTKRRKASPSTDKSDTEDGEVKREQNVNVCDSSSYDNWKGFVKNGNGHPVMGHQLSALLAQNGHNNGGATSPVLSEATMDVSGQDDNSSIGAKDEEDDDEDDDGSEDRLDGSGNGDPEKLKAFNMFVRLFVDENLDRCMPISKQPKEKVQAIIDSCTRQFPEFATRARKRIRTYLKSCRRTKRTREQAGLDMSDLRPTPPHLTSVQAEQLLARACENESDNAKRMRMGLEPISQPMPIFTTQPNLIDVLASCSSMTMTPTQHLFPNMSALNPVDIKGAMNGSSGGEKQLKTEYKPEQLASLLQAAASQPVPVMMTSSSSGSSSHITSTMAPGLPQSPLMPSTFPGLNGATLYRPPFQPTPTFPQNAAILQQQQQTTSQNGPSLDSLKKAPLLNHKLNSTEISAVRQLVTGYRESAAFLLRSADELEHLLQIQPKL